MEIKKLLARLVDEYRGDPLAIVATGAAISLGQLATVPGSSRILDSFCVPYSYESSKYIVGKVKEEGSDFPSPVSEATAILLTKGTKAITDRPCCFVSITGAVITNRYRRGDNYAFICVSKDSLFKTYKIKLTKHPELFYTILKKEAPEVIQTIRDRQDIIVASQVIAILLNDFSIMNKYSRDIECFTFVPSETN